MLAQLGVGPRARLLVAGSTHKGEDAVVAEQFLRLRARFPDLFLVLVPRHFERSREVGSLQVPAVLVPGAVSLNEDRWNELLPQFLATWSPDKKVVVYCSTQNCNASREVAKRLRDEAQLKNVFVLQGGWEEWLKQKK